VGIIFFIVFGVAKTDATHSRHRDTRLQRRTFTAMHVYNDALTNSAYVTFHAYARIYMQ